MSVKGHGEMVNKAHWFIGISDVMISLIENRFGNEVIFAGL